MSCQTLLPRAKGEREVFDAIIASKRIVVLTGAGISVAAGLPDFRSKDGLYALLNPATCSGSDSDSTTERSAKRFKGSPGIKGQDLFSANVFRDPHATALFYKFISSLHRLCASDEVQPTATHHFVSKLARRGKLLRYYTQNIDCLEDEVGLTQALDLHSSSGSSSSSSGASKRFNGHCVQLHGRIDRVKCGCGYVGDWSDDVLAEMSEGFAPSCPGCDERADVRRSLRKRSIKQVGHMGALKPAITLYDDAPSPDEHTIAAISDSDLRRKPDLVLVLGTSLKIPGFKNLVKDFVFQARQRSGKQNVRAVLINATDVLSTEWKGVFDYFVHDKCDDFVKRLSSHWKKAKPDDWMHQVAFSDVSNAAVVKAATAVPPKRSSPRSTPSTPLSETLHLLPAFDDGPPHKASSKRTLQRQDSSVIFMGSTPLDGPSAAIRASPSSPKSPSHPSFNRKRQRSLSLSVPANEISLSMPKPFWSWSSFYASKK